MAKTANAQLFYEVAFDMRSQQPEGDGAGNYEGNWVEQFRCRAAFLHLRGSETVMAGRLQGRHMQVVRVRVSEHSVLVATGWRLRDVRRGIAFNIRDIEWETNRQFIALTCESGVATG